MDEPTSAEILSNPDAYNVEQVIGALEGASAAQVAAAQAAESAGRGRKRIMDFALPVSDNEPRFARERILDPVEGPAITGLRFAVIAGALAGEDAAEFTRTEVALRAKAFRERVAHPVEG